MSDELEIAALASAGALASLPPDERDRPEGTCANCGADSDGNYCPNCGQRDSDFHRPVLTMLGEILSDVFSLDGRLARTVPSILFRPGRVTRAYLEGHRARYVPPFRMFLVSSLVFFSTLFMIGDDQDWFSGIEITTVDEGQVNMSLGGVVFATDTVGPDSQQPDSVDLNDLFQDDGTVDQDRLEDFLLEEVEFESEEEREAALEAASRASDGLNKILSQPRLFASILQNWAPRLSLLMFPIFAFFLTLLYAWRRQIFIYDHLVTSLHFQSYLYLSGTILMLAGLLIGGWAGGIFAILVPVYLYRLLRKTYGTGRIMSFIRAVVLWIASLITINVLIITLVVIGFVQV